MSCQPLRSGNSLFTENNAGRLTELTREGEVVRTFDVKAKGMGHVSSVMELTPAKKVAWELKDPALKKVLSVKPLNGSAAI